MCIRDSSTRSASTTPRTTNREQGTVVDDPSKKKVKLKKTNSKETGSKKREVQKVAVRKSTPKKKKEQKDDLKKKDVQKVAARKSQPKKKSQQKDDLKKVKGIGPVIEKLLHKNRIYTFKDLASTKLTVLRNILEEAEISIQDPKDWPRQAKQLAK